MGNLNEDMVIQLIAFGLIKLANVAGTAAEVSDGVMPLTLSCTLRAKWLHYGPALQRI